MGAAGSRGHSRLPWAQQAPVGLTVVGLWPVRWARRGHVVAVMFITAGLNSGNSRGKLISVKPVAHYLKWKK